MPEAERNILLVDDEVIIALSEKQVLEKFGYRVTITTSGNDALAVLKKGDPIDLVLMDIDLGYGIDGIETARQILNQEDLPVVFLSSHTESSVVEQTETVSSYGYVVKSSNAAVLDASIKMAFKLFSARQELERRGKELEVQSEMLQDKNALFEILVNNLQIGIFMVEAPSGKPLLANEKAKELLGRGIVQEANRDTLAKIYKAYKGSLDTVYPPDEMPVVSAMYGVASHIDDMLLERPDGTQMLLEVFGTPVRDSTGKITASIASFWDITERKKSERLLRDKTVLLSLIMDTSPVGIVTVGSDDNITWANLRAEELLGLKKDEITSRTYNAPLWKCTGVDGKPLAPEDFPVAKAKATMEPVFDIRHSVILPDGRITWLSVNAQSMTDDKGQFAGVVATFEDITDRIMNERALERQLREKETVLKEVHHRIKNNIASIESILNLQKEEASNEYVKNAITDAIGRVESMRMLYDKLLVEDTFESVSVKSYVIDLIQVIKNIFRPAIEIEFIMNIDDFYIETKKMFSLGVIINELVTNSLKYAFVDRDSGIIEIIITVQSGKAFLNFKDNGIGLQPKATNSSSGGFGTMLIHIFSEQLHAELVFENNDGLSCTLSFAL